MFTEKEMSRAIRWLFEQYVPADYEGYDEGEIGCAGGLYLPEVCISLRDLDQPVYQYSVQGGAEKGFDYRGPELFDQRACPLYVRVERTVMDAASTRYQTELWLLEDMTFAVVRCVAIAFGGAHGKTQRESNLCRSGQIHFRPYRGKGLGNMADIPRGLFLVWAFFLSGRK